MIKRIIKSAFATVLAAVMLASSACARDEREYTRIAGEDIYFASEAETEKWREPLEKLLSNTVGLQFEDEITGEPLPNNPPYPDRPSVEKGYGCALFDLTRDGIPELLVNLGGGVSSGVVTHRAYDIYTGEVLGEFDGSSGSLCCYYAGKDEGIKTVNKYSFRCGWSGKSYYTSFIEPAVGGFTEKMYLESHYEMEMKSLSENDFTIVCKSMTCEVWGEETEPENYLFERECFDENYIRIPETVMKYVSWYGLVSDDDTPEEQGEKMTEALLSTGQRFIAYGAE